MKWLAGSSRRRKALSKGYVLKLTAELYILTGLDVGVPVGTLVDARVGSPFTGESCGATKIVGEGEITDDGIGVGVAVSVSTAIVGLFRVIVGT